MKTHKGAKKRFKLTASGKVKRGKAGHSHILTKKTCKRKPAKMGALVTSADSKRIKRLLQA